MRFEHEDAVNGCYVGIQLRNQAFGWFWKRVLCWGRVWGEVGCGAGNVALCIIGPRGCVHFFKANLSNGHLALLHTEEPGLSWQYEPMCFDSTRGSL